MSQLRKLWQWLWNTLFACVCPRKVPSSVAAFGCDVWKVQWSHPLCCLKKEGNLRAPGKRLWAIMPWPSWWSFLRNPNYFNINPEPWLWKTDSEGSQYWISYRLCYFFRSLEVNITLHWHRSHDTIFLSHSSFQKDVWGFFSSTAEYLSVKKALFISGIHFFE